MTETEQPQDASEEKLLSVLSKVEGLIGPSDALTLYRAAKRLPPGANVVEIGSFKGKSTICLALGLKDSGNASARVYAVDPFQGGLSPTKQLQPSFADFQRNIAAAGVQGWVVPKQMTSEASAKAWAGKAIDLLWVDGYHIYPAPANDIRWWKPFMGEGARLLVDDFHFPGVPRSVFEEVVRSRDFRDLRLGGGLASAVKGRCSAVEQVIKAFYFLAWTSLSRLRSSGLKQPFQRI